MTMRPINLEICFDNPTEKSHILYVSESHGGKQNLILWQVGM
jgi:hypothetical protein